MLHVASLGSLLVQKVRGGRVWYGDSVSAWAKKTKQKIMLSISRSDAVEALLLLAVDAWWVVDLWRSACFTDYYAIRQYVRLQYTVCAQCTRLSSLLTTIAYTPLHSILPCPHFQSDPSLHRRISTSHHIPSTPPSHTKPFPGLDPQPQYPNPIPMSSPRTNPPLASASLSLPLYLGHCPIYTRKTTTRIPSSHHRLARDFLNPAQTALRPRSIPLHSTDRIDRHSSIS